MFGGRGSKRDNSGIGFAGDARGDAAKRKKLQKLVLANEDKETKIQEVTLRSALQSLSTQPSAASTILILSNEWLNHIKSVLRNQADWSCNRKCVLYQLALDCCEVILNQFPKQLGDEDDSESLIVTLLEMASTAQVVSNHSQDYSRKVQLLATQVLDLKDRALHMSRAVVEKEDLLVVGNRDHYRNALRPFAFDFVDSLLGHVFENQRSTSSCQSTKQRQKILRELGTYKTALPVEYGSSIFVRAVENRMDLLRILIIGPEDSPYENGCFFFDIHLVGYPTSPPKVQFLTTGGGKYRFNPNLYKDGNVCLSLLGTWSGPSWENGTSTLLQVLVSIQSLIFVDQPYFNEPGFQASEGTPHGKRESERYNENIRRYALDAAILPHLQRLTGVTTSIYPEFDAVIEKHFRLKEHALKTQLSKWRNTKVQESTHTRYPSYMYPHQAENRGPSLESLYISCVSAIDSWKRKQKVRDVRSNTTNGASPVLLDCDSQTEPIRAVEVNGVVEILDEPQSVISAIPITSRPRVGPPSNLSKATTAEVIDLTK